VWGFLKYHHPKITAGTLHWDYELFRILPSILAATNPASANERLVEWIDHLGELAPGSPPNSDDSNLHLPSPKTWLGSDDPSTQRLAKHLQAVHAGRSSDPNQFYLSKVPGVGNPSFDHEPAYTGVSLPDSGYQLLALYRFWNIIRYWFPYRDLIDENWHAVLREFIPRIGLSRTTDDYQLELMALIAKVHDTHANLWSSLRVRPPAGEHQLPAIIRFAEGRPVVSEIVATPGETTGSFRHGDIIMEIDDKPIEELIKAWTPYYAASNEPTRMRDIARNMGRGTAGTTKVRVLRGSETMDLDVARVPVSSIPNTVGRTHDLPGPPFRLLSNDVAYLKLSDVKAADVRNYVEQAAQTKGWIIDIRNYPSEFVVFALGQHLVDKATEFVSFTTGDPANPGAFSYTKTLSLQPKAPHYAGNLVILIDEVTQSSAEYTAMAFRTAPRATVIGSTTAAADGNVSRIPLPGGVNSMISGIGVFYPDRRPTQRVGIIPDIEVKPTVAGIRERRDELLEAALRQILGPEAKTEEIRKLSVGQ
jgi:C-terminal processing protease CtpA/Prc